MPIHARQIFKIRKGAKTSWGSNFKEVIHLAALYSSFEVWRFALLHATCVDVTGNSWLPMYHM